jgi:hypothetical protein
MEEEVGSEAELDNLAQREGKIDMKIGNLLDRGTESWLSLPGGLNFLKYIRGKYISVKALIEIISFGPKSSVSPTSVQNAFKTHKLR